MTLNQPKLLVAPQMIATFLNFQSTATVAQVIGPPFMALSMFVQNAADEAEVMDAENITVAFDNAQRSVGVFTLVVALVDLKEGVVLKKRDQYLLEKSRQGFDRLFEQDAFLGACRKAKMAGILVHVTVSLTRDALCCLAGQRELLRELRNVYLYFVAIIASHLDLPTKPLAGSVILQTRMSFQYFADLLFIHDKVCG